MGWRGFFLLIALALPLGGAGDGRLDRATLRGVKAMNIVIDPVAPDVEKQGARADALRSRLEERLKAEAMPLDQDALDFVGLRLTSVRSPKSRVGGSDAFAIAMTIAFYQRVALVRDPDVKTVTQTWEVETLVLADTKQVTRACLDSVDELAARFVAAYRSANSTANDAK